MDPFLQQEDRTALTRARLADDGDIGRLDQRRVLAPVDEAGEVAVVVVRPARGLLRDARDLAQSRDRLPSHVEHDVIRAAGNPEHGIVLRGGHLEVARADDVAVESRKPRRCVSWSDRPPQLRPEAGDQVDAPHRGARFAEAGHTAHQRGGRDAVLDVELEVRVGGGPEREYAGLWRGHRCVNTGFFTALLPTRNHAWFGSIIARPVRVPRSA